MFNNFNIIKKDKNIPNLSFLKEPKIKKIYKKYGIIKFQNFNYSNELEQFT